MVPLSGRLLAIWIKRCKGGPMDAVTSAALVAGRGLAGNANQGGKRQVTLMEAEIWQQVMQELQADLPPSRRRANLLISGLPLLNSRGRILSIGAAQLRILGETRPCEQMESAWPELEAALKRPWYGGAFAEVVTDAEIQVGDAIGWAGATETS